MLALTISVTLIIAVFFLSTRFIKIQEKKDENARMQMYMDSERVYYNALADQTQLIREYRHDLAGHIRTLEYLIKNTKQNDLNASLQDLIKEHQQVSMPIYCRHEVVNALLFSFAQHCRKDHIEFSVDISAVDFSFMRITDLNALLHNLLENAADECLKIDDSTKRQISLTAFSREQLIYLQAKNSVRENLQLKFVSGKKNSDDHGIGNLVITRIIQEYQGTITDHLDQNEWHLLREITFPLH